ncbi:MAG: glycosyltransferase family 2 protein [Patescibacteria group bacterium]|nr:glycosyltransferase family 2 protein [Patescibacteria group bacterium]
MPLVSVNILTKNRAGLLRRALLSVAAQSFKDFEVVVVNDGSSDETQEVIERLKIENLKIITHQESKGITAGRQEALQASAGKYIAVLDDDDEWIDADKLKKQVGYLNEHRDCVLLGGGIQISNIQFPISKTRPETDGEIRRAMLLKNPFFTSTVMFRREAALKAGGFVKDSDDLAEDYDLWLRLGLLGGMHNFQEPFVRYSRSSYNKGRFRAFLAKQLRLISRHKRNYPKYFLAKLILKARLVLGA